MTWTEGYLRRYKAARKEWVSVRPNSQKTTWSGPLFCVMVGDRRRSSDLPKPNDKRNAPLLEKK